jgi:fibronectin type 3 domain-containing protein
VKQEGVTLESGDSAPAIVTPKDIFPPEAPRDLVAAVLPEANAGASVVDLSWSLNVETDLAGYRIYRSESEGSRGAALTPELLPTPAYRDTTAQGGRKYWYTVTAVDRAGNESNPSAAVTVEIP